LTAAPVLETLRSAGETLSVAESCTGGWLGRDITSVPGASASFWGGIIAYDNSAKLSLLSVSPETLRTHGAVSEPTAEEMAAGVARISGTTWSLAITGLAGPAGGTRERPVGTVCMAISGPVRLCRTYRFVGGREEVREKAVAEAFALLAEALESR
jgi:nicotinamide-nucleotide amidase